MATVIGSFVELHQYIDNILNTSGDLPVGPPHKQFWDNMTYDAFINGTVPGVIDRNTGQPVKILVVGNSGASNLIMALSGTGIFGPGGSIPRMPLGGPFWTPDQIAPIAAWIDAACPQ